MGRFFSAFAYLGILSSVALAENPKGFEDPVVYADVMAGKVVIQKLVDTPTELHAFIRSYFNKVSPDAYVDLATNHPKYAQLFTEIKKGTTLKSNADKTEFEYQLDIAMKMGPIVKIIKTILEQKVVRAPDAISETVINQKVLNFPEKVSYSMAKTRLIPWEAGMLVEDEVHFILTPEGATGGVLKAQVEKLFSRYTATFRTELGGY